MKTVIITLLTVLITFTSWMTKADNNSKEYKLGAFSGAMKYCEDKFDDTERYKWARLRAAEEFKDMSGAEKFSYGLGRDNANRKGQYFGKKLDKNECRTLLHLSEWKRFKQR